MTSLDPNSPFYEPDIETMSRAELAALQLQRLQWQLQRCYEHSPFHREKFDRAGVKPDSLRSLEDLRRFPITTKQELRDEQAAHPPLGRYTVARPTQWREVHPSTGTTGEPVYNLWAETDIEHITTWTARTLWSFGVRPGNVVQNAFSYGLWVAGLSVHYAARRLGCFCIPIGSAPAERQTDYIRSLKPDILLATPSFALYIAETLKKQGMPPQENSLRLGCFGGEPGAAVETTRHKIEAGLGIRTFDYYGLSEIGPTIASECTEQTGLHWAEDYLLVEVLDPETQEPLPNNSPGIIVITHLTKIATPMIRYWTGDIGLLDTAPCPCGRTHARSPGGILGRADDMIVYRGANFYPTQVEKVVRGFDWLSDEFRIRLTTPEHQSTDVCTVVAEYLGSVDQTETNRERLRNALRGELQVGPRVEFVSPNTLERTMFKAHRVEDHRKRG
jgi:phenylacetate-CoA ligase